MDKKKIAFVVVRYGNEINGGAEYHCRMLAERLVDKYQVEVLTTCVFNYLEGGNTFEPGESYLNGVLIRRFMVDPINPESYKLYTNKAKYARKLRKILYKMGILKFLANKFPVWRLGTKAEKKALYAQLFYSSSLVSFIQLHKDEYKAFIPITIDYPLMYFVAQEAPEKTILIPTMHNNGTAFRSVLTMVFTKVAYIAFNTGAEQHLAEELFGNQMAPHGVVSVGIEHFNTLDWNGISSKFHLPEDYLLYVGRVSEDKINHVLDYFLAYKRKYPTSTLKFVLVGGYFLRKKRKESNDIIYTGFVTDEEKITMLKHARIAINPSKFESLSLILLEALDSGKPMLVNAKCNVLQEHCIKSNGAVVGYTNKRSFIKQLRTLDKNPQLCVEMGQKGIDYVHQNYDWNLIINRLRLAIENIGEKHGK